MEMVKSVAAKYLTLEQVKAIAAKLQAKPGDLMIMVAGDNALVSIVLGRMRQEMGIKLGLVDLRCFCFCFYQ